MTVGELIERLHEFDESLEIRALARTADGEGYCTHEFFADLPAHEAFVLLHDHDAIESTEAWTEPLGDDA